MLAGGTRSFLFVEGACERHVDYPSWLLYVLRSLLIPDVGRALQSPNGSESFQIRCCAEALIFSPTTLLQTRLRSRVRPPRWTRQRTQLQMRQWTPLRTWLTEKVAALAYIALRS